MSVNVGVVDWFTKKQMDLHSPEDVNKGYGALASLIRRSFKEKDLASVAEMLYEGLQRSDFYQNMSSDPYVPVCSIFNQSRSTSAVAVCLAMDQCQLDKSYVSACLREYNITNTELNAYDNLADFIGLVRICALLHNIGKIHQDSPVSNSPAFLEGIRKLLQEIITDQAVREIVERYTLRKIFNQIYVNNGDPLTVPKLEQLILNAAKVASFSGGRFEIRWSLDSKKLTIHSEDSLFIHEIELPGQTNTSAANPCILGNHGNISYNLATGTQNPHSPLFVDRVCKCRPVNIPLAPVSIEGEIGYLAMDIMQIQTYVTEADKLPILRGGSRIVEEILKKSRQKISTDLCRETVLFAGGGNLLALVPVNPSIQASLKAAVEEIVKKESGGVLNAAVVLGTAPLANLAGNFSEVMKKIQDSLEEAKQAPHDAEILRIRDHLSLCPACKKRPILEKASEAYNGPEPLCSPCERKRQKGRDEAAESYYPSDIMKQNGLKIPTELQHIGDTIAVIAVDGNMMGRIFQNTHTPADFTYKSETFDRRFKNVISETIRGFVKSDLAKNEKSHIVIHTVKDADDRKIKYVGINPVYIGGDDILLIMNARGALDFCRQLVSNVADEFRFEHQMMNGETVNYPTVTISCGIAVADMKFPIYFLLDAARSMESKAKEEFRAKTLTNKYSHISISDGSLAFTAISGAMPGEDAHVFVIPAKGQSGTNDSKALDRIIQMLHLSIAGEDLEKRMIATVVACGNSEEERLNILKFQYAATLRKQGATPKEWLDTCELLATVLTQKKTLEACQLMVPFVWHVSEESS